jgi:histone deacetylase 11
MMKKKTNIHYLLKMAAVLVVLLILMAVYITRLPDNPEAKEGNVLDNGVVVVYSPGYRVSFFGIEKFHSFDIGKYDFIAEFLVKEGVLEIDDFFVPEPVDIKVLQSIHDTNYLGSLNNAKNLSGALEVYIPGVFGQGVISQRILSPFKRSTGGTILATQKALENGMDINIGGGFHHARPDMGHGFCVYNDVAAAIHTVRGEGFTGKILIVDTDVHQGDGNHAFFADDPTVFSFSMHQGDIFPHPKLKGNLDVELEAGTGDSEYLRLLKKNLHKTLDEAKPDLIFHVAGADVLHDDPLADLSLTIDGLVKRDLLLTKEIRKRNIPLVHLLAGGYGPSAAKAQALSLSNILRMGDE